MKRGVLLGLLATGLFWMSACGDDSSNPAGGAGPGPGGSGGSGGSGASGGAGGSGAAGGSGGGSGGGSIAGASCFGEAPADATHAPAPPAYSGGTCPALAAGFNTLDSAGNTRVFRLAVPAEILPGERLPVVFLWHWMGGSADDFYERGEVQAAVDQQRFIAVIPEAKGDIVLFGQLELQWPYDTTQSSDRMEEEFVFFDDMLTCVTEQFSVNSDCVASAGVSAGALFTDQLAGGRGQYLSSILSLSGGVGGNLIKPWTQPEHKMPAMVLWGGPTDACFSLMNFEETSLELETGLGSGGHFFLECVHNCGHAQPPIDVPAGSSAFAPLWQFVFDHPYWLKPGESPYNDTGVPAMLPEWCAIGAASATPRTGECLEPPGC